uniref:Secreted protein n=1 Tax=Sipha flava TaxID=143950 RepID=A0A2S2PYM3_9HEMI
MISVHIFSAHGVVIIIIACTTGTLSSPVRPPLDDHFSPANENNIKSYVLCARRTIRVLCAADATESRGEIGKGKKNHKKKKETIHSRCSLCVRVDLGIPPRMT